MPAARILRRRPRHDRGLKAATKPGRYQTKNTPAGLMGEKRDEERGREERKPTGALNCAYCLVCSPLLFLVFRLTYILTQQKWASSGIWEKTRPIWRQENLPQAGRQHPGHFCCPRRAERISRWQDKRRCSARNRDVLAASSPGRPNSLPGCLCRPRWHPLDSRPRRHRRTSRRRPLRSNPLHRWPRAGR